MGAATSSAWRARLVMFLALFLVPVVIVATPSVASAATSVSGEKKGAFGWDDWEPGNWASCSFNAWYSVQDTPESSAEGDRFLQSIKINSGNCETGFYLDLNGALLTLTFTGSEPSGAACSASVSELIDDSEETFGPLAVSVTGLMPHTVDQLCTVTDFCWAVTEDNWLPGSNSKTDYGSCESFLMGVPEVPQIAALAGCDWNNLDGTVETTSPVKVEMEITGEHWYYHTPVGRFKVTMSEAPTAPYSLGVVFNMTGGNYGKSRLTMTFAPGQTVAEWGGLDWASMQTTAGVQFFPVEQRASDGWTQGVQSVNRPGPWNGKNPLNVAPGGSYGVTAPQECFYFFGDQAWDDPTSADDVPAGDLAGGGRDPVDEPDPDEDPTPPVTPPVDDEEEDEGCEGGFSIFRPSTWVSVGFCHVVSALSTLIKGVRALPGLIADAFGALFLPDSGFIADKVDSVKNRWNDTAPVVLVDEVAGLGDTFAIPSPGGCAGPDLNIETDFTGALSLNPLSACGPYVSVVANIVKIALTVIVYVGAGLGALRIMGSALGLDLSIDKNGE